MAAMSSSQHSRDPIARKREASAARILATSRKPFTITASAPADVSIGIAMIARGDTAET